MEKKVFSMLEQIMKKLDEHSEQHENHRATFKEQGQILSALLTGQEYLKAEIEGMKIVNAKEFGSMKQRLDKTDAYTDLLRDESWKNKADIHRIKNTMGMN